MTMSQAIYRTVNDAATCPICHGRNTEHLDPPDVDPGGFNWLWECYDCGKEYTVEFGVCGYRIEPREKSKYAPCVCPVCHAITRTVLAVAAPGRGDDWGVYIGVVPGEKHSAEVDGVIANGTKQPRHIATALFPQFDPEKYRD